MWIDSHCHLNHENIAQSGSPEELAGRARDAGIDGMVNICCRIADEFPTILETARALDNVWCSVGTHPHDAGIAAEQEIPAEKIAEIALSDPKIIGIGESGLDYFYDNSPRQEQQTSFRKHIRACLQTGMPLIVHARDADADIIRIIREETAGQEKPLNGVMHCFSSSPEMGRQALDLGFYISFSGIVTFKKSTQLQEFAREVPINKILVETDAPFLAPEPHRGKINEPSFVANTGRYVADLKKIDEEEFAAITTRNFYALFDRAKMTQAA